MRILFSTSHVPACNAALEESLFRGRLQQPTLLLYQDTPALLIGRHQVPWREISLTRFTASPIPLLRRISGGGTVYLDLGCLAFAFLLPTSQIQRETWIQIALDAIRSFGIPVQMDQRLSVFADGRKVVGSAFAFRTDAALVHGSILVQTELAELRSLLALNPGITFRTDAVPSVPAPVANLQDFAPTLTIPALADAFAERLQSSIEPITPPTPDDSRFLSDDWNWFRSPDFTATLPDGTTAAFSEHQFISSNPFPIP